MKSCLVALALAGAMLTGCKNEATKACQAESVVDHGPGGRPDSDCEKCCEGHKTSSRADLPKSGTNVCACYDPPAGR